MWNAKLHDEEEDDELPRYEEEEEEGAEVPHGDVVEEVEEIIVEEEPRGRGTAAAPAARKPAPKPKAKKAKSLRRRKRLKPSPRRKPRRKRPRKKAASARSAEGFAGIRKGQRSPYQHIRSGAEAIARWRRYGCASSFALNLRLIEGLAQTWIRRVNFVFPA